MAEQVLNADELREAWSLLPPDDRVEGFRLLETGEAEEFFLDLDAGDQYELLTHMRAAEQRLWLRLLPPDDAADLLQEAEEHERAELLALIDSQTRREVTALLAYEEDEAGGLMSSRFSRVRPDMTVDEAIASFHRALRGTARRARTYEALCQCFIERGQYAVTAAVLQRATQ